MRWCSPSERNSVQWPVVAQHPLPCSQLNSTRQSECLHILCIPVTGDMSPTRHVSAGLFNRKGLLLCKDKFFSLWPIIVVLSKHFLTMQSVSIPGKLWPNAVDYTPCVTRCPQVSPGHHCKNPSTNRTMHTQQDLPCAQGAVGTLKAHRCALMRLLRWGAGSRPAELGLGNAVSWRSHWRFSAKKRPSKFLPA